MLETLPENRHVCVGEIKSEPLFVMDSTGCFPGFMNVYQKCSSASLHECSGRNLEHAEEAVKLFQNEHYLIYPSPTAVQSFLRELKSTAEVHGPAVTTTPTYLLETSSMKSDLVYCIPCLGWPPSAQEWLTRDRPHNNPTPEIVTTIAKMGCHLVPTDHPLSKNKGVS